MTEEKQKELLNQQYKALETRLISEPNIILRYEIKLAMDVLTQVYGLLFNDKEDVK